jgi:cell division transport system permease protein
LFDRLAFILGEALFAIRRNGVMNFAAISTVAVSLFLLGGAGYAYYRAVEYANTIPGKFDMRVYLVDDATEQTVSQVADKIRKIPGVGTVNWMPKDAAWQRFKDQNPDFIKKIGDIGNPLPHGFKVTVKELSDGPVVARAISNMPAVRPNEGVQYLREEQEMVDQGIRILRWLGTGVGGLLLFTAGILIFNAIKLAVLARQREIRIMRLVGASPLTVFVPFLIEGAIQGIVGGLVAGGLLYLANLRFGEFLTSLSSKGEVPAFPIVSTLAILAAAGAMYGIFCSTLSLRARGSVQ